jgi:hypothetical protein
VAVGSGDRDGIGEADAPRRRVVDLAGVLLLGGDVGQLAAELAALEREAEAGGDARGEREAAEAQQRSAGAAGCRPV